MKSRQYFYPNIDAALSDMSLQDQPARVGDRAQVPPSIQPRSGSEGWQRNVNGQNHGAQQAVEHDKQICKCMEQGVWLYGLQAMRCMYAAAEAVLSYSCCCKGIVRFAPLPSVEPHLPPKAQEAAPVFRSWRMRRT